MRSNLLGLTATCVVGLSSKVALGLSLEEWVNTTLHTGFDSDIPEED